MEVDANDGEQSMRLIQLKMTNFRCYKDEIEIDLDDLVVFVGKNDSGKSSLFDYTVHADSTSFRTCNI